MSNKVWISGIMRDCQIGDKQGLQWKFPNKGWSSPTHIMPIETEESVSRLRRYNEGFPLSGYDFPEALAIWDKRSFMRTGDLFSARGIYAVKAPLAEIFSQFDLGDDGLTPLTIYESDLTTPAKGEYWLLRLGVRKDTFLSDQSNQENYRVRHFSDDPATGLPRWKTSFGLQDGDVAVSSAALEGEDLWVEARVWNSLFMSEGLAEALSNAKLKNLDFRLKQCRVISR